MAFRDTARGLLGGINRFAAGVNGLLYPGFGAGLDPQTAQRVQSQAMMAMGAGLLGGDDFGRAYKTGQISGTQPLEEMRRQKLLELEQAQRKEMADWREWQKQQAEQAAARQEKLDYQNLKDRNRSVVRERVRDMDTEKWRERDYNLRVAQMGRQEAPADQRYAEWYMSLPPEQQAVVDKLRGGDGSQRKPLPTSALRIVDEAQQAAAAASDSKVLVDNAVKILESGGVQLGAIRNLESRARNFAGSSDENSRAYANIQQTLEKLRNNYLLLAKGVQTEGDAQRAWNSEIGENVQNDNALALQQLRKAQAMNERALAAQNARIDTVYNNFGMEAPSDSAQPSGAVPQFATEAEAEAAFRAGKIMRGQKVIVGGVSGKWQ